MGIQLSLAMENRIRYNLAMKILLTTLHAKYVHASLALPYLASACGNIEGVETVIREFTINELHDFILREIVEEEADVAAFSCYIWNIGQTLRLVSDLKKILPKTRVILGGPEVSYNAAEILEKNGAVDCVIRGEGEETFHQLVTGWKQSGDLARVPDSVSCGINFRTGSEIAVKPGGGEVRDLDSIPSPFSAGLVDLGKPLIYFETSRGCPFSCAFCMSSLASGVNSFSMERITGDLLYLMTHRAETVKLVDRTFNYDADRANRIWEFILRHNISSRFHFEIAADLLTGENLALLEKVPEGMFRFEIGVQSGSRETLAEVARKTDIDRLMYNVRQLVSRTGVVTHLDLIAGLPGEDFGGFLGSLGKLFEVGPHYIQVEPLKVLKGSPMEEIALREGYAFSCHPPYKILGTPHLSFREISQIEAISRLLDIYYNSGRFATLLKAISQYETLTDFFQAFAKCFEREEIPFGLSQKGGFELIWNHIKASYARKISDFLRDALCYDFCMCEYPAAGNLPAFMEPEEIIEPKITRGDIVKSFGIERDSKVRTFARRFLNDYTLTLWNKETTAILFVYISASGRGLQVKATPMQERAWATDRVKGA